MRPPQLPNCIYPRKVHENGVYILKTHQMFTVHTMPEIKELENDALILKTHLGHVFSFHSTPEKLENKNLTLRKARAAVT